MQILSAKQDVADFSQRFSRSLQIDPYSWKDWYGLLVQASAAADETENTHLTARAHIELSLLLRRTLSVPQGILVILDAGRTLLLAHLPDGLNLQKLTAPLLAALPNDFPPLMLEAACLWQAPEAVLRWLPSMAEWKSQKNDDSILALLVPQLEQLLSIWPHTRAQRCQRTRPHILIIDDDPVVRRLTSCAFKATHAVASAPDVVVGVEKHLSLAPDLVFLDIDMPVCDGFFMLDFLKQHDPDAQIVMFSANDFVRHRLRALSDGAHGFIAKPFKRQHFEHYINQWQPQIVSPPA